MEHAEVYTLEAASAPLSPKITSPCLTPLRKVVEEPTASSDISNLTPKTLSVQNNVNVALSGLCFKTSQSVMGLETLHENSQSNDLVGDLDSICFDQSFDIGSIKRKRKWVSPEQPNASVKRKRDKSYSERKKKVSEFFKTPLNYFSNRRRTIDAATFNQSLNESVISSSGIFNVDTVQNLNAFNENELTPRVAQKRVKKNLFSRTFSSSKFNRGKSKKSLDLNATKLSFGEPSEADKEKLNASCFPDISFNPTSGNTCELSSAHTKASGRSSVSAAVVLTSFHCLKYLVVKSLLKKWEGM